VLTRTRLNAKRTQIINGSNVIEKANEYANPNFDENFSLSLKTMFTIDVTGVMLPIRESVSWLKMLTNRSTK